MKPRIDFYQEFDVGRIEHSRILRSGSEISVISVMTVAKSPRLVHFLWGVTRQENLPPVLPQVFISVYMREGSLGTRLKLNYCRVKLSNGRNFHVGVMLSSDAELSPPMTATLLVSREKNREPNRKPHLFRRTCLLLNDEELRNRASPEIASSLLSRIGNEE